VSNTAVRTAVFAFHAPMQSWGTASKLATRDTRSMPSRSGILGLVRSALGDPRQGNEQLSKRLNQTKISVRVDRPGVRTRDYHTITANPPVAFTGEGSKNKTTIISERWYLSDAAFLVTIESPQDSSIVQELFSAAESPMWHLCLGRRSCPPVFPFALGVLDMSSVEILRQAPSMAREDRPLTISVEHERAAECEALGWKGHGFSEDMAQPVFGPGRMWAPDRRTLFTMTDSPSPAGVVALASWVQAQATEGTSS